MHNTKYCFSGNIVLVPEVLGKYQSKTWTLREIFDLESDNLPDKRQCLFCVVHHLILAL